MSEPVRYISVAEVAAGTGLSQAAVRKRAERKQWRRLGSKPQKYRLEDVLAAGESDKGSQQEDDADTPP